jgi:hypothetical protein
MFVFEVRQETTRDLSKQINFHPFLLASDTKFRRQKTGYGLEMLEMKAYVHITLCFNEMDN